jgi:hypothetical protein
MNDRLPTHLRTSALIRRVDAAGGSAMVLNKGDSDAGCILVLALERGENARFLERGMDRNGTLSILRTGPDDAADSLAQTDYWQRRCRNDPDLWVIEVDVAEAERFVAETILQG